MKIESSYINMTSFHKSIETHEITESLTIWLGEQGQETQDIIDLTTDGKKELLLSAKNKTSVTVAVKEYEEIEISDEDKLKVKLLESFIETLTGKKVKLQIPRIKLKKTDNNTPNQILEPTKQGWGLSYDYQEFHHEKETLSFSTQGIVKTQDGREVNINLQLNMTREFMEYNEIQIRAGDAKKVDPLVINYDGGFPSLTEQTFFFDLDADGSEEQISLLKENSGFLSLDLNNDGTINDGRELFGPKSGDGFSDLAQYDNDGNSWIDENDSIFHKLRIWTKDSKGKDYLLALGEVGVGAIFLGSVGTMFSMKGQDNQLLGQIQKTGLFLKEDGTAGTIQHIDLAV
jgi:hypothetical protein